MNQNVTQLFSENQRCASSSTNKTWRGFIKDLEVQAFVGIYEEERQTPQKIIVNIEYTYNAPTPSEKNDITQVVCYAKFCQSIENIIQSEHTFFLENLAEKIAILCFEDERIQEIKVSIKKFPPNINAQSLGIEISRDRNSVT